MITGAVVYWLVISLNYVLLAVGLALSFSVMRIVNLAHGHLYMAGAFVCYALLEFTPLPWVASMLLSLILIGGLGMVIERWLYRRMGGRHLAQIVLMSAMLLLLEGIAEIIFGGDDRALLAPVSGVLSLGTLSISVERLYVAATALLAIIALYCFLRFTRQGKAVRATAQDEYGASLLGINVGTVSTLVMGIASAMAALAGIQLTAVFLLSPYVGVGALVNALLIITLGGLSSVVGSIAGAFIIGGLEVFGAMAVGRYSSLLGFAAVILILIVRPQGLFGRPE